MELEFCALPSQRINIHRPEQELGYTGNAPAESLAAEALQNRGCAFMADYKTIKVDIGPESSFTKLPAQVEIGDWSYFLAKSRKGVYQLLSTVCPHAMGEVVDWGNTFMCPDHGWLFEKSEGICINGPNSRMTAFPVEVEAGRLVASVPND